MIASQSIALNRNPNLREIYFCLILYRTSTKFSCPVLVRIHPICHSLQNASSKDEFSRNSGYILVIRS